MVCHTHELSFRSNSYQASLHIEARAKNGQFVYRHYGSKRPPDNPKMNSAQGHHGMRETLR